MAKAAATKKQKKFAPRYCSIEKRKPRIFNKKISPERARLIRQNEDKWANGAVLRYYFFDKKTDGAFVKNEAGIKEWKPWVGTKSQMDVVRRAFKIWKSIGIGLDFKEVKKREDADIRIAFMEDDGAWSYLGRDIRRRRKDPRTMNFGWNIATRDRYNGIDTALHEIGHTLGFPHEHQNPFAGIVWNEKAVYEDLGGAPNYWDEETTYTNIIEKIDRNEVNGSNWDPNSIMHYYFKKGLILKPEQFKNKALSPAGGLSKQDIQFALQFYPSQNPIEDIIVTGMNSYTIDVQNCEQQNYIFIPPATKKYTIQTIGQLDTVMVLFEKISKDETKYVAGDDNSGTDKNALITTKFSKGKTYVIKIKVYYKKPGEQTALMIS
jgi:hypothetical protein